MIGKIRNSKLYLIPVLIFFPLTLVLMIGSIQAFGPGSRDRGGYSRSNKPSETKSLNLTPEQEALLKGLRDKFLDETVSVRSELPRKLIELRTLWLEPKPDVEKINAKKREIIDLFTQLQIKSTNNRLEAQTFIPAEKVEKLPVLGLHLEIEPDWLFGSKL